MEQQSPTAIPEPVKGGNKLIPIIIGVVVVIIVVVLAVVLLGSQNTQPESTSEQQQTQDTPPAETPPIEVDTTVQEEAILSIFKPEVTVIRNGREVVYSGDEVKVYAGDRIITDEDAVAHIIFADNSLLSLDNNTEIVLTIYETNEDGLQISIDQLLGRTWHRVESLGEGDNYEIETSNTVASVRGTRFSCVVISPSVTECSTSEGSIRMELTELTDSGLDNIIDLEAGEQFLNDNEIVLEADSFEELLEQISEFIPDAEDQVWDVFIDCFDGVGSECVDEFVDDLEVVREGVGDSGEPEIPLPQYIYVPNVAPDAVNDSASTPYEAAKSIYVLDNDSDSDGNLVYSTLKVVTGAGHGTAVVSSYTKGTIKYTPDSEYSGTDTFTYEICDNDGACDTATVSIKVHTRPNESPIANDDSAQTDRNQNVDIDLVANDTDSDGTIDASTTTVTIAAEHGSVSMNTSGVATYVPDTGYIGVDTFTYEVCDNDGDCDTAVVTVTVNNILPVALDEATYTLRNQYVEISLLDNDSDSDGTIDPTSATVTVPAPNGDVTINTSGVATYTPDTNYIGVDTFTYQVCDNDGGCDTAIVTVTVENIPPSIVDDGTFDVNYEGGITINVQNNDSDSDGTLVNSTISISTQATYGTATANTGAGNVSYSAPQDYSGADSFEYELCDNDGACDTATVTVNVLEAEFLGSLTASSIGGTDDEKAYVVKYDSSGNTYTAGIFQGSVNFDPDGVGEFRNSNTNSIDMFVTKRDQFGNHIWTMTLGSDGSDYIYDLAIDPSGYFAITGTFQGVVDFDPGAGTHNLTYSGPTYTYSDTFAGKYDLDGNFVWAYGQGLVGYGSAAYGVEFDDVGDIYYIGQYRHSGPGNWEIFFRKLASADGMMLWDYGTNGAVDETGISLAFDGTDFYMTGRYSDTVDFSLGGTTSVNLTSTGSHDAFLAKYDKDGILIWVKTIGGTDIEYGQSVDVNGGIVVVAGSTTSAAAIFDIGGVGDTHLNSGPGKDIFMAAFDTSGNYQWGGLIGGVSDDGGNGTYDYWGQEVAVNSNGQIYLTGYFSSASVDFDLTAGIDLQNNSYTSGFDTFVSVYTSAGDYIGTEVYGGVGNDFGYGIAEYGNYVCLVGSYDSPMIDFAGDGSGYIYNAGGEDAFISNFWMDETNYQGAQI